MKDGTSDLALLFILLLLEGFASEKPDENRVNSYIRRAGMHSFHSLVPPNIAWSLGLGHWSFA
jgi:hypothetical protein